MSDYTQLSPALYVQLHLTQVYKYNTTIVGKEKEGGRLTRACARALLHAVALEPSQQTARDLNTHI